MSPRDSFETWATNRGHDIRRYSSGDYVSPRTRELLECWLACAQLSEGGDHA